MTISECLAVVTPVASKYNLDPALVCAVVEQESGWDQWSIRFEPAFYEHDIPVGHNPTEAHARATSWGLMQVMGQTARELGFSELWLSQLCDPQVGIEYGCKKLVECIAARPNDTEAALLKYNGGGNPDYGLQVLARVNKYKENQ